MNLFCHKTDWTPGSVRDGVVHPTAKKKLPTQISVGSLDYYI